jgi:hypothetical protein
VRRSAILALALLACTSAAPATQAELLAAEQAVFSAIAHRDPVAFGALLEDGFVLRMPGAPDVGRAAAIEATAHVPGGAMVVTGEQLAASPLGHDLGVVSGVQVGTLELNGEHVVDRSAFTDVFRRGADGHWRIVFAHNVPLP